MANHKLPIRTYQRKKKPSTNTSLTLSVKSIQNYTSIKNNCFDNSETFDGSVTNPFETTFDRIAKGAVVPPLAFDVSDSWNSSTSYDGINSATNLLKSPTNIDCNNIPNLTHKNVKQTRKCRKSQKYKKEIIPKPRTKKEKNVIYKISVTNGVQSKAMAQGQKRQTKVQKKRAEDKENKSSRKYNNCAYYSDITNKNSKDAVYKGFLCDYNNQCSVQNILKTDKDTTTSKITSNQMDNSKQKLNYYEDIKPCFVKLDTHTVQDWYMLNYERIMRNKQNTKYTYENILKTNEDSSKIQNTSQSISIDHNDFEIMEPTLKPCFVVLRDVFKKKQNKENMDGSINELDEINASHLVFTHNLLKTAPHYGTNTDNWIFDRKRGKAYMIRDCVVKTKKLKIEQQPVEEKAIKLKKKYVVSSTPISRHIKPSIHPMILSPIKNICDTLNTKHETPMVIKQKYTSVRDVCTSGIFSEQQGSSIRSSITSEYCKTDITDTQEQQSQVKVPFQKLSMPTDIAIEVETISSNKNIHPILPQKYNVKSDIRTELPSCSLNISADTNQTRSLFSDTINCSHSTEAIKSDKKSISVGNALKDESAKISTVTTSLRLSADFNLMQEKRLLIGDVLTDTSIKLEISKGLNDIECKGQECGDQKKRNAETNSMEIICENSKHETVNNNKSSRGKNQDRLSTSDVDVHSSLTTLQDSTKITQRIRYSKWHPFVSNISKNVDDISTLYNNEMPYYVVTDNLSNVPLIKTNLEHSRSVTGSSLDYRKSFDDTDQQQHSNDTNVQKSLFLEPGKYWARSLSILSNVNPSSDLNKLCAGKGKKWRKSVKKIFNMQKQGTFESCFKKDPNNTNLSHGEHEDALIASLDNNSKTFDSTKHFSRISKRVSIKVVPNVSNKCNVIDTPFLEAFGITTDNSSSQLETLDEKNLSLRGIEYNSKDHIFESHPRTAKDVVLQRCSQQRYLLFSEHFPDSYLEHCRKIGEGVYGEVFLHEHNDEKSVIKIIPIEGETLINGEVQKKFNEILSEIVIAEELHNLRSHSTCKTSAFVEVQNIKCIIGRYPEKLVKLWKIYDDDKASDNDCPSMYEECQLYVIFKLGHGGEDLEAFVFQTAEEAYAAFLQIILALAVAEQAFEFEHRDLHWGNILISRSKESYVYYSLNGKEIKIPSNNVKVSIIDYTLSRMLYKGCCIYNDLALDPALFNAHGEYQFEIYRLMRNKIMNNWQKFEPYTNVLWLHYILDKMITAVRYKRKNVKAHKQGVSKLKKLKSTILNYDSAYNFVNDSDKFKRWI